MTQAQLSTNVAVVQILSAVQQSLTEALLAVVTGEAADVQRFAAAMVEDAAEAAAANRPELLQVLTDQAAVLAEVKRLRVDAASRAAFNNVIQVSLGIAIKLLVPALVAAI